ncbi:unnamed protein product [Mortierella alpina]
MSLPRFLRGLQKKTPATHQHSSTGEQHLSDGSSSSSSSGPKDALGYPIPVTTSIITTTLAPAHVESNQSSAGSSPSASLYPGPMDIISKRISAGSAPGSVLSSAASSLKSDSHDLTSMGTPQRRRARDRTSQASSRSSFSSIRNTRDPMGHESISLLSTSCPQSTMPSSFDLSSAPPMPLSTLVPTTATIPTVNITTPSESRPPRPLYPRPSISEAPAAAPKIITGFDVDPFAIHEDRYAHAATATVTKEDGGDPLSSRTWMEDAHAKRRSKEVAQILPHTDAQAPVHSHPTRGNRVRSNAVAYSSGTNSRHADANSDMDANQDPAAPIDTAGHDLVPETSSHPSGPLERVSKPRSRSSFGSPAAPAASGASHTSQASHASKDAIRLQRHERDSGSGSHHGRLHQYQQQQHHHQQQQPPNQLLPPRRQPDIAQCPVPMLHPPHPLPMQDGSSASPPLIQAFPAPPTGLRTSISSDTSTLSRSSLYLQQDPMATDRRRDDLQNGQEASPKSNHNSHSPSQSSNSNSYSSSSRRSSLQAHRCLSVGEPDVSLSVFHFRNKGHYHARVCRVTTNLEAELL